jgi:hypothetical protein
MGCARRISVLLSVDGCHCWRLVLGDGNRKVPAWPARRLGNPAAFQVREAVFLVVLGRAPSGWWALFGLHGRWRTVTTETGTETGACSCCGTCLSESRYQGRRLKGKASLGVTTVAVEKLPIDPLPRRRKQKPNEVGHVLGGPESSGGLLLDSTGSD